MRAATAQRLLLVDDSPEDLATYRRWLGGDDEQVLRETESGEEALDLCRREPFDCIVLDYHLPDLDGLEFLQRLAAHAARPPVVMLTGQGSEDVAVEALKHGAADYLVKGRISADGLQRAIARAVETADLQRRLNEHQRALERSLAALRASEDDYRQLIEGVRDYAVYRLDLEGRVVTWNAGAERILGYRAEEVLGRHFATFHTADDVRAGAPARALASAKAEGTFHAVGWRQRRDGSPVWADVRITALRDETERLLGFTHVTHDISELRRADEALAAAEARYRAVGEAIPFGVWVSDAGGGMEYLSRSFLDLVGLTMEAARGLGWTRALAPDDLERTLRDWRACIEGCEFWDYEYRIRGADGRQCTVLSRGVPIRSAEGRLIGWAGMHLDITDRKAAEDRLREEARRKDEFLALLAHELRNPLAPIVHTVELLHAAGDDPALRGHAVTILERQSRHLVRIVDDLLDVARIQRGKLELRKERLDARDAIRNALETVALAMRQARHETTVSLPGEPLPVEADPVRLEQLLVNLVGNAIKFTPEGGAIALEAERGADEVVIRVRDTGAGIAPELLPRIFEPFVQGDTSLARGVVGIGIGLALCRGIAELHDGTIEARSEGPGRGSEFVARLPLACGGQDAPTAPPTDAPTARRLDVLVVDDNVDAADCLGQMVTRLGHESRVVYDGASALSAAAERAPDVVLLDISMPGMDGLEVARRLRAGGLRSTLLAAVTGYGRAEDEARTREAGFDRHLVKPLAFDTLRTLLAERAVAGA